MGSTHRLSDMTRLFPRLRIRVVSAHLFLFKHFFALFQARINGLNTTTSMISMTQADRRRHVAVSVRQLLDDDQ